MTKWPRDQFLWGMKACHGSSLLDWMKFHQHKTALKGWSGLSALLT